MDLNCLADGEKSKAAVYCKLLMTIAILAVMIARQPELLYEPRFFAEEGMKYFSFAFNNSLFDTLVTAHYGYFTLYNSFATAIAAMFPLENAPLATTYCALCVQLLTVGMVIWNKSPIFDTLVKRFTVALAIPLISYAEIWLNTIGMQYWFCIMTFLLLLEEPAAAGGGLQTGKYGLLALAGMTGVVSCFMTPVFLLKALQTKSKKFMGYSAVLTVCSLLQVSAFARAWLLHNQEVQMRLVTNSPLSLLIKTVIFQFAIPFSGRGLYEQSAMTKLSDAIDRLIISVHGGSPFQSGFFALPFVTGTVIILFLTYQTVTKIMRPDIRYIALSFLLVSGFSVLFSVNMSGGPRYTFAPSIMLVTLLIALLGDPRCHGVTLLFSSLLLVCSLTANAAEFRRTMSLSYNPEFPAWREEVRIWRLVGPAYPLKIWPPPWTMYLNKPAVK